MDKIDQIEHSLHNLVSPKRGHTFWGLLGVLLIAAILIWIKHGEWIPNANNYGLLDSPDGLKNYMTTAWHLEHDSSYVHYGGMSYPYGEHVLFTDNQPIFSAALQWWSRHVSDLHGLSTGLINIFQVLSLLFGACIIFLLLRKLHLPVWYAGIAALGILFLSPQYNRFDGHFGLSHTWVLPFLLLLLCRYEERQSRRYQSLLIGILLFIVAQLHFYYFGVAALFLGLYTAYQVMLNFRWRNIAKRIYHLIVMVIVPFALLNIWIHWSDYYTDRPASPYGFTTYIGYWEGVFLPYESFPMHKWISDNIIPIRSVGGEAQAYVGLIAFAFTLWLMFGRRFKMFEATWNEAAYHRVHKNYLNGIFFASFVLLIFSCGFPFAIPGMGWMVDYFGPLKQFRGLGRFTWVFYYVINLLVFYVLWNRSVRIKPDQSWREEFQLNWDKIKKGQLRKCRFVNTKKWAIAVLPLLVLCYEAWTFQKSKQLHLTPNLAKRELAAPSPDHWLNKVDFTGYQAVMPLPYHHVGSENIWLDINYPIFKKTLYTSLHTGLPDMGVFLSRTSIGNTVKSVQWSELPMEPPRILQDLPNNKPIALMIEPEKWDDVQWHYPHLIEKAKLVFESPDIKIMSLIPDSVRAYSRQMARSVEKEMNQTAPLKPIERGWFTTHTDNSFFMYESYDSMNTSGHAFQGNGSYSGNFSDTTWIWNKSMPKGDYSLTLWVQVTEDMGFTQEAKIIERNLDDGHQVGFRHEGIRFHTVGIVDGWALFDIIFTVYENNSAVDIFLQKENLKGSFYLDEVMIKPTDCTVYRQEPGWVSRNNYWFRL
ncbi:MAG: hypothetical protein R3A50_10515 [Saprospiraceae bacterium]